MNLFKVHNHHSQSQIFHISKTSPFRSIHYYSHGFKFPLKTVTPFSSSNLSPLSHYAPTFNVSCISKQARPSLLQDDDDDDDDGEGDVNSVAQFEDLAQDGDVYQKTLRLVECSMFAAVTGLVYFLSNSLSIENYFGCFFSLPIVISSMRWGVAAGRKTMVATAMLLFVLSGPLKALTYLLTHGIVGFTMGSLWRLRADWGLSIFLCTIARATGAMGYVFVTSFLIRENILALITINIHASLTLIFAAIGINTIPSMNLIYTLFGILVILATTFSLLYIYS